MAKAFPETTLTVEGQTYRLLLDINAQVLLEDRLSTPEKEVVFQHVATMAMKGSIRYQRWLFWASLQRHHPEITPEQAGDIMSSAERPALAMADALEQTSPDPADVKELGIKPKRPRKARTAA